MVATTATGTRMVARIACDRCPRAFTDPEADGFADLLARAYALGWLFDGPWRICPDCAPFCHLDAPSDLVQQIRACFEGADIGKIPDIAAEVVLVHEGAPAGMWQCPGCTQVFGRYTPDHPPCNDPAELAAAIVHAAGEAIEQARNGSVTSPVRTMGSRPARENDAITAAVFGGEDPQQPASTPGLDANPPPSGPGAGPPEHEPALDQAAPLAIGHWGVRDDETEGQE